MKFYNTNLKKKHVKDKTKPIKASPYFSNNR